jgi:hypothetical protein
MAEHRTGKTSRGNLRWPPTGRSRWTRPEVAPSYFDLQRDAESRPGSEENARRAAVMLGDLMTEMSC